MTVVAHEEVLRVLGRLPAALFRVRIAEGELSRGARYDEGVYDESQYDMPGGAVIDEPPQYSLARMLAERVAEVVAGWREAERLVRACGRVRRGEDGHWVGEAPHATGADLDRLGAAFGVERPYGFGDACYWRLVQLIVFAPGCGPRRLLDVAELFTGTRPAVEEVPGVIRLVWPRPSRTNLWPYGLAFVEHAFADHVHGVVEYAGELPVAALDAFAREGPIRSDSETFAGDLEAGAVQGMTFAQALDRVRPAGVLVDVVWLPVLGTVGCLGADRRRSWTRRGRIAAGAGDG